jgi:hypothetical protein
MITRLSDNVDCELVFLSPVLRPAQAMRLQHTLLMRVSLGTEFSKLIWELIVMAPAALY